MQLLAQYPLTSEVVTPYFGRPLAVAMADGDIEYGVIDRIHDGHLIMRPYDAPPAAVMQVKKSVKNNPAVQSAIKGSSEKMKTKAFYGAGAYPYGWGYGNYGWGAGWWWIFPLFAITALLAFPFFW